MAAVAQTPKVVDAVTRLIENKNAMENPQVRREKIEVQDALERIAEKRKRAMEWGYGGVLTPPQLHEELARLEMEETTLRAQMKAIEARGMERSRTAIGRERVFATLRDFPRIRDALTLEEQKIFVRSAIICVEVLSRGVSRILCRENLLGGLEATRRDTQGNYQTPNGHVYDLTANGCPLAVISYTNNSWQVDMRV
ncbi:MAG TPA: hypothetical protein VHM88_13380 [Candidatus Acidoferrales bacterium]|nr:hypothetical protein [Candidatus Acidoferrales bacterium]